MNSSGFIRKIDDLGRIVIPMEIRKTLNIQNNDIINFEISDQKIVLSKSSIVNNNLDLLQEISDSLSYTIDGNYFICDRDKILFSSLDELVNKKLEDNFTELLSLNYEYGIVNTNKKFYVYPYFVDGVVSGFIVLFDINSYDKYIKLIKYIANYIMIKLSIS